MRIETVHNTISSIVHKKQDYSHYTNIVQRQAAARSNELLDDLIAELNTSDLDSIKKLRKKSRINFGLKTLTMVATGIGLGAILDNSSSYVLPTVWGTAGLVVGTKILPKFLDYQRTFNWIEDRVQDRYNLEE